MELKKVTLQEQHFEAIAMRTKEIITAMEKDAKFKFKSLKVDGGASNNNLLMQIQSNLLGVNVFALKLRKLLHWVQLFLLDLLVVFGHL